MCAQQLRTVYPAQSLLALFDSGALHGTSAERTPARNYHRARCRRLLLILACPRVELAADDHVGCTQRDSDSVKFRQPIFECDERSYWATATANQLASPQLRCKRAHAPTCCTSPVEQVQQFPAPWLHCERSRGAVHGFGAAHRALVQALQ